MATNQKLKFSDFKIRFEKEMIRNFFVAKNLLWKKATYITNIEHKMEMKELLNEALFGVFKTNPTMYMRPPFNENLFKILIESLPVLD